MFPSSAASITREHESALGVFNYAKQKLEQVIAKAKAKNAKNATKISELVTENHTLNILEARANHQIEQIDRIIGTEHE